MQWFKHDSTAATDAKIKKVLIRYGPTGYAVYFHCLELICSDLNETNITFQLEHDSEIIADNLKVKGTADKSGIEIVEEIMRYMVEIGLFENQGGRIFCFKLLKRLDSSMTSNEKMRSFLVNAKSYQKKLLIDVDENHDEVMTESCKKRIEENRREENRREENRREGTTKANGKHKGKPVNSASLKTLISDYGQATVDTYFDKIISWEQSKGKAGYKDYAAACRNWLMRDSVPKQLYRDENGTDEEVEAYRRLAEKQRGKA